MKVYNTKGMRRCSSQADIGHLLASKPEIMVLTETKLHTKQVKASWLRSLMAGYTLLDSCTPHDPERARGRAGVLIAIRKDYSIYGKITCLPAPPAVQGHALGMRIELDGSPPLLVAGVYAPSGNDTISLACRAATYEYLSNLTTTAANDTLVLMAGDWNATLYRQDRSSGTEYAADLAHRSFMALTGLQPVDTGPRIHTFSARDDSTGTTSRIDDLYYRAPTNKPMDPAMLGSVTIVDDGLTSDHRVLLACLRQEATGLTILRESPPRPTPAREVLRTPIAAASKQQFQNNVHIELESEIQDLQEALDTIYQDDVTPFYEQLGRDSDGSSSIRLAFVQGRPAAQRVNELAEQLTNIITACHKVALQSCPTRWTNPGGVKHMPRQAANRRKGLCHTRKAIRAMSSVARTLGLSTPDAMVQYVRDNESTFPPQTGQVLDKMVQKFVNLEHDQVGNVLGPDQPPPPDPQRGEGAGTLSALLSAAEEANNDLIRAMDKAHVRAKTQQDARAQRKLINRQPRKAHRAMFGKSDDGGPLKAVRDPATGLVTSQPSKMAEIVTNYYGPRLQPAQGKRTGLYLPTDVPRDYPWKQPGLDGFKLATDATARQRRLWLHNCIGDGKAFEECYHTLNNGKSAGPDGITNELLKMMPHEIKHIVHKLFIIMWATGTTPHAWKVNDTCLLHKKGDETDLDNRRPIGLANALYKVWTRLVTKVLYEYAEAHRVLSASQGGFRSMQNTARQVQLLVSAIEDARQTGHDLYLLQIDFTKAFDTMDHDKLLVVMYDLGFPTDAIDIVKDLYTGARTRYKLPHGPTEEVAIERGTVQGDCLSPFLFDIYIEPLLRWLHAGERGYRFGCLASPEEKVRHAIAALGYADDVIAPTSTLSDTHVQAEKISKYADWAALSVSHNKTTVTAILHRSAGSGVHGNRDPTAQAQAQLEGRVRIQGQPIKYLAPTEAFTYLGVKLTLTLDWRPQTSALMDAIRAKAERLTQSHASPRQVIRIIHTCIKAAASYSFFVAPCSMADLDFMDRAIVRVVKKAFGLAIAFPSVMIHEDIDRGGLGVPSLRVEAMSKAAAALVDCLQDTGRLGAVTYALLKFQSSHMGGLNALQCPHEARYCMRIRQLTAIKLSGLELTQGEPSAPVRPIIDLAANELAEVVGHLTLDPTALGIPFHVPLGFLQPLFAMGVHHVKDILERDGKHVINITTFKLQFGAKVRRQHACALNRLALLLNHHMEPLLTHNAHHTSKDLPKDKRRIHTDNLALLTAGEGIGAAAQTWWRPQAPQEHTPTDQGRGQQPREQPPDQTGTPCRGRGG